MAQIGGGEERPWAIVLGLDGDADELVALFPYARHVQYVSEVEPSEFDLLVTDQDMSPGFGGKTEIDGYRDLTVLSFGGVVPGKEVSDENLTFLTKLRQARRDYGSRTRTLVVADELSKPIASLSRDLAVLSKARIDADPEFSHETLVGDSTLDVVLSTKDGKPIVAHWLRQPDGLAEVWAFPSYADPVSWTRAIVDDLAVTRTGWMRATPEPDSWRRHSEWTSSSEAEARTRIDSEMKEFSVQRDQHERQLDVLNTQLAKAEAEAEDSFLLLVTCEGDDLVKSVQSALQFLGFETETMDAVRPEGDRREDLRVRDPTVSGWVAIAEVRSYKGGAQEETYHRLMSKFLAGYIFETGKQPDSVWWFANTFKGRDLRQRDLIMATKPDIIEVFGESGGLAIDTADLLHLVLRVDRNEVSSDDARELLRSSTGRLQEYERLSTVGSIEPEHWDG